jgi:hypothetical protein
MRDCAKALETAGKEGAPSVVNLYSMATKAGPTTSGYNSYYARYMTTTTPDATMRPYRLQAIKTLKSIGTPEARNRLGRLAIFGAEAETKKAAKTALEDLKKGNKK